MVFTKTYNFIGIIYTSIENYETYMKVKFKMEEICTKNRLTSRIDMSLTLFYVQIKSYQH